MSRYSPRARGLAGKIDLIEFFLQRLVGPLTSPRVLRLVGWAAHRANPNQASNCEKDAFHHTCKVAVDSASTKTCAPSTPVRASTSRAPSRAARPAPPASSTTTPTAVTKAAANSGYECPYLEETRACNTHACRPCNEHARPTDCVHGHWGSYTACDKSCNAS